MSTSKNDLLVKNLVEFGFSDKEAKIYITLLSLEIATANEIAKAANINRSSTYVVLEGLKNKGFVGLSNDKKVQGYVAVSPDIILETLESNIKKQNILRDQIKNIIPDLKGLDKSSKKAPVVRVFEGESGLREAMFDIFDTEIKDVRVYENPGDFLLHFPDYVKKDKEKRINRGIKMFNICPNEGASMEIVNTYKQLGSIDEFSQISKSMFRYPIDIAIYGNKIVFSSTPEMKDKVGIIIEHTDIAEALKCLFDLAWEEAKRIRTNKDDALGSNNKTSARKSKNKK